MCRVSGELLSGNLEKILSFSLDHRGRTQFSDDRRVSSPEKYLMSVGTVHFVPEDVGLVGGPPAWRRKVLDRGIFETRPGYWSEYRRFLVALRQRNALFRKGYVAPEEKEGWDHALAETGSWIIKRRWELLGILNPEIMALGKKLGLGDGVFLRYQPSFETAPAAPDLPEAGRSEWSAGSEKDQETERKLLVEKMLEALSRVKDRELKNRHTLVGPHRDGITFCLKGTGPPLDLARYGSQGQKRGAVLALKLGLARTIANARGEWPLVIMDDVSSELDGDRRAALGGILEAMDAQVFVSATRPDDMILGAGEAYSWKVLEGTLKAAP